MAVDRNGIELAQVMVEHLETAEPDLLRELVRLFVQALMSADADAACGAAYGTRRPERTNSGNGYRTRDWDTRVGSIDLALPRLRAGRYFPDWLLERRKRAVKALVTVVATSSLFGVSTRRMEKLVEQLGIKHLSKSQVSVMARELDENVESFCTRPLDAGPYTFVAADTLSMSVREAARVAKVHALIVTGVNADGHPEILGLYVATAEDAAGLVAAIGATLPGAGWQRSSANIVRGGMVPLVHLRRRERTLAA